MDSCLTSKSKDLYDLGHKNFLQDTSLKAKEIKAKMNDWHFLKITSFCTAKQTINKTKINLWNRRRHLQMILQIKGWYPRSIKNFSNSTPKKWAQDTKRYFSRKDIQMANRHRKKCSPSLAIGEIQIKTTMRYHLTPVRLVKINKAGGAWVAQWLSVCLQLRT